MKLSQTINKNQFGTLLTAIFGAKLISKKINGHTIKLAEIDGDLYTYGTYKSHNQPMGSELIKLDKASVIQKVSESALFLLKNKDFFEIIKVSRSAVRELREMMSTGVYGRKSPTWNDMKMLSSTEVVRISGNYV